MRMLLTSIYFELSLHLCLIPHFMFLNVNDIFKLHFVV